MSNKYSKTPAKVKYDGIHDNAEITWNGRAFITSDISDEVLFNIFFDPDLVPETVSMLKTINQSNLEGKDLGDVIPCDCLNTSTIEAISRHIHDVLASPLDTTVHIDGAGCLSGEIYAEEVVPDYVHYAEEYLTEVGHEDTARNELFGNLYKKSIKWKWPVEITINGKKAYITDLKTDAVTRILDSMLYCEANHGMW